MKKTHNRVVPICVFVICRWH